MKPVATHVVDRRMAIGAGIAAATGLAWPRHQAMRRVIIQRGIAGGGVVQYDGGAASFSLFASSLAFEEGETGGAERVFVGTVTWADETVGETLVCTRVTNYENLNSEVGEARRIEGLMRAGDGGDYPFVMDVLNLDAPGAGTDTVTLMVGASAAFGEAATPVAETEFNYFAQGTIVSGDVQDIDLAIDVDTGDVSDPDAAP